MIILGIDPGLCYTGWGIIKHNPGSPAFIDCGVIAPCKNLTIEKRLLKLHKGIIEVIKKFLPNEVALEKIFVNNNASTTLKLGEARGVILMTPASLGLGVKEYTPNTIKKVVTGKGHASKEQIKKMVELILGESMLKQKKDSIDALAIALCHYYSLRL